MGCLLRSMTAEDLRENEEGELGDEEHDQEDEQEDDEAEPDAKRGRYEEAEEPEEARYCPA